MNNRKNTWYLLKQWLPIIIIAPIILLAVGDRILRGDILPVVLGAAGLVALFVIIFYLYGDNRTRRLLQSDSPRPLVEFFDTSLGRSSLPDRDAYCTFSKSLAYTLYGQFALAKNEIRRVDWTQRPPLVKASAKYLEAIWAYLELHDYPRGLALAREARQLCSVSSVFPGAGITLGGYDAAVAMGESLCDYTDATALAALEKKMKRLPSLNKVMAAWALERSYRQLNRVAEAQQMRALINNLAPYCKALSKAP